jgi:hypothetical protein
MSPNETRGGLPSGRAGSTVLPMNLPVSKSRQLTR